MAAFLIGVALCGVALALGWMPLYLGRVGEWLIDWGCPEPRDG